MKFSVVVYLVQYVCKLRPCAVHAVSHDICGIFRSERMHGGSPVRIPRVDPTEVAGGTGGIEFASIL